jgi:predicted DNA-binding transcriptional regulator YafY
MRADRLLAILLRLQNKGRTTAQTLAEELEVTVRTIYRDIDALSTAGVPVYTERGPGGGISLLDTYQTTLTGLKEDEIRALFLLTIPTPLAQLGFSQQLTGALLKLRASLPATLNQDEDRIHQHLYLDWAGWHRLNEQVPHLRSIQDAVWHDQMLVIQYRSMVRDQIVERAIAPYSLVAKAGTWYLVGASAGRERVYRVSRIVGVVQLTDKFNRPASFHLVSFWENWCKTYEAQHTYFRVQARIRPQLIPYLAYILGDQVLESANITQSPDQEGWIPVELTFESFEVARGHILSFGRAIDVIEPQALRASVIDYAEQIVSFYAEKL